MQPHHRVHAGGGHGISGLEVRKNIKLHFSPEEIGIARAKLRYGLRDSGGVLYALTRPRMGLRRLVEQLHCGLLQDG